MDLAQLIQLLLRTDQPDFNDEDEQRLGQNRRWIYPELGAARNFNQTPGNPPVTLQEGGWLRSLIPYETGEGGPPGLYNDDGKVRQLQELFQLRYPDLMRGYQKEAQRNRQPPPEPSIGRETIKVLENLYRYKGNL